MIFIRNTYDRLRYIQVSYNFLISFCVNEVLTCDQGRTNISITLKSRDCKIIM